MKLLIVDDDKAVLQMLVDFCLAFGHTIQSTNDSRTALRIVCEEETRFELIITDWQMPVWSGLTLALKIRNFERMDGMIRTPILCVTGDAETLTRFNERDGKPIDEILLKGSFNLNQLEAKIQQMTKGTGAHA